VLVLYKDMVFVDMYWYKSNCKFDHNLSIHVIYLISCLATIRIFIYCHFINHHLLICIFVNPICKFYHKLIIFVMYLIHCLDNHPSIHVLYCHFINHILRLLQLLYFWVCGDTAPYGRGRGNMV
jgi:hypothetical protein